MTFMPRPLIGLLLLALVGCASVLPKPAPPPSLYRVTAAAEFAASPDPIPVQLAVELPAAEAALDTTRIALSRSATTLDYFADAAWTDRLAIMLQAQLLASFDNAHRLAAAGPESGALRADAVLVTELRHFEAVYAGNGSPRWRVEIAAKLVKQPERTILADRDFRGEEAAARNDLAAIVDASDLAWRGVAAQIVDWTAATLAKKR